MRRLGNGFSLIEVVVALGVVAFALLTMLALLPIGLNTNHVSSDETRATFILTKIESDLRNTYPGANNGKSIFLGLALPYALNGSGRVILNSGLTAGSASTTASPPYSVGLNANEEPTSAASTPLYQASVVYTYVPGASPQPMQIEARLIVNWPFLNTTNPLDLTSPGKVRGFVESYVSFPAP